MREKISIMKKLGLGLLGLFLLVVGFYFIWIQFPTIQNPSRLKAMERSARDRFEALQLEAQDPQRNGYLTKTFLPFWGRVGMERQKDSPIEKTVEAWKQYGTPAKGELVDHSALTSDGKYRAALKAFEEISPNWFAL